MITKSNGNLFPLDIDCPSTAIDVESSHDTPEWMRDVINSDEPNQVAIGKEIPAEEYVIWVSLFYALRWPDQEVTLICSGSSHALAYKISDMINQHPIFELEQSNGDREIRFSNGSRILVDSTNPRGYGSLRGRRPDAMAMHYYRKDIDIITNVVQPMMLNDDQTLIVMTNQDIATVELLESLQYRDYRFGMEGI